MFTMEITRLIERCRQGDADALGELYKAYAQRMRGMCRRYISDEEAVSDVLHDAFVIIFTSFDRLRDAKKAESWMMMITRNVASKYKDHLNALPVIPLTEVPETDLLATDDEIQDVRGIPLEEVMKMVDEMPDGYGKVFRLSVFDGLSHKEIAAMLGIEPHSSSSQLARAKKILRKKMQQYWAAVLLLLLLPLTFFLLNKEDDGEHQSSDGEYQSSDGEHQASTTIEKPVIAKQKDTPKQKTQTIEPSIEQAQEPIIIHIPVHHTPIDTLQPVIVQATTDSIQNNEQADTTHIIDKPNLPHYNIADLFPEKPVTSPPNKQRWSIELAYAGGMGEQNFSRPYGFTETPTLAISGEPPSPVTFENWSDYAAFLADNPDDGNSHTRRVIMNIALNNANDDPGTGTDKIIRKSHHYMPINFSLALKYRLNNRFALETGLSYSRMKSDFEMGSNGNTINEQQIIHYLGIPVKGIYNIYNRKAWSLYGSLGVTTEIPVYSSLNTSYYLHGILEATDQTTTRAPWQWSVGTGLGMQYNLTPNIGLFAEPSLQYYIPTGTLIETYRTKQPFNFSLPLGIRFTW